MRLTPRRQSAHRTCPPGTTGAFPLASPCLTPRSKSPVPLVKINEFLKLSMHKHPCHRFTSSGSTSGGLQQNRVHAAELHHGQHRQLQHRPQQQQHGPAPLHLLHDQDLHHLGQSLRPTLELRTSPQKDDQGTEYNCPKHYLQGCLPGCVSE